MRSINIREPFATLIVSGQKTVETRRYALPLHVRGERVAVVATHGRGGPRAVIVGTVVFDSCEKYDDHEAWLAAADKHFVTNESQYRYEHSRPTFGWSISEARRLIKPVPAPTRRGIIFTNHINFNDRDSRFIK